MIMILENCLPWMTNIGSIHDLLEDSDGSVTSNQYKK